MKLSNQYDISYVDIPRGIELSLKNSDRHKADAEILANEARYNSAIPLITLAVEEFGKALWLSEYFEKNTSIPHKVGYLIFTSHRPKIDKVLEYVKSNVKSRTIKTRKQYSEDTFHIPEEFDEQNFKKRMWYVDYQKTQNPKPTWKKQPWKNPLYIEELDFGEEDYPASDTLSLKYYELWRCAFHGISKFRRSPLYDKILNALPPEEFSFEQISFYIEKHFLLEENPASISYDGLTMDIDITPTHPWITPILTNIIKEHVQKKYQVKQVHIILNSEVFGGSF